jgi:isoleucyl-tRNA synthetase
MRYTDVWNDLTEKMGYWVDMEDPYVTYKPKYMETVWWLLKQIYNKDLMYKGYTIQPYSPKAGTGLSSHEVNQPGSYRDVTDTVVAQFKVLESSRELLCSKFYDYISSKNLQHYKASVLDLDEIYFSLGQQPLDFNTALTVGPKSIMF